SGPHRGELRGGADAGVRSDQASRARVVDFIVRGSARARGRVDRRPRRIAHGPGGHRGVSREAQPSLPPRVGSGDVVAIRTSKEYRSGLLDGRRVHFQGTRIASVMAEPALRKCVEHSAIAFDIAEDPELRELAVEVEDGEQFSAFYRLPRSARDLERRAELIEATAARGGTVIVLKEVGTDALFGL